MTQQEYLTTADIAGWFGVSRRTVIKWRERYPDFPGPDVVIQSRAGWKPDREQEIREWHRSRPGAGTRSDLN